jgi:phosphoglucosamine mutase
VRNLFGTDGIRGIANEYPITVDVCHRIAEAIAATLCNSKEKRHTVVIGKDTRISGSMIEHAMAAAFCSCGVDVKLLGVVPTPAVAILTPMLGASVGIMITASHNKFNYNGIKLFDEDGLKLSDEMESSIEGINASPLLRQIDPQDIGQIEYVPEVVDIYCNKIIDSFCAFNNDDIRKIVVDCANGSFSHIAPIIFKKLGFNVIAIHNSLNGININEKCGVMHPSIITDAVLLHKADVGIAFDGDGDRVILVDRSGKQKNGEQILATLAKSSSSKKVVSTVVCNFAFEKYLKSIGIELIKTEVGDRYISEYMRTEKDVEFGAETSGHVIIKSHALTGDGLFAALKIIEYGGIENFPFTPCPVMTTNVLVKDKSVVDNETLREIIQRKQEQLHGRGKLIVRPSGTEPLVRISVDGENEEELKHIMEEVLETIGKLL